MFGHELYWWERFRGSKQASFTVCCICYLNTWTLVKNCFPILQYSYCFTLLRLSREEKGERESNNFPCIWQNECLLAYLGEPQLSTLTFHKSRENTAKTRKDPSGYWTVRVWPGQSFLSAKVQQLSPPITGAHSGALSACLPLRHVAWSSWPKSVEGKA